MPGSICNKFRVALLIALPLGVLAGCRSPYVQTTITNTGTTEIRNIELDYPSASFGISDLAPGSSFHYRLKLQDAGRMKIQFFDRAEKPHSGKGPYAVEGQQGTLFITLDGSGKNVWSAKLTPTVATPKDE